MLSEWAIASTGVRIFTEVDLFQEGVSNGSIPLFLQGDIETPVEVTVRSVLRGTENEATRKCKKHF